MKRTANDKAEWRGYWINALNNMPRYSPNRPPSKIALLKMLGYKLSEDSLGRRGTSFDMQRYSAMAQRGTLPKNPEVANLLKMLGGPHGKTIAKAVVIRRNLDLSKWKYWP
jgi:hypothetical protein